MSVKSVKSENAVTAGVLYVEAAHQPADERMGPGGRLVLQVAAGIVVFIKVHPMKIERYGMDGEAMAPVHICSVQGFENWMDSVKAFEGSMAPSLAGALTLLGDPSLTEGV